MQFSIRQAIFPLHSLPLLLLPLSNAYAQFRTLFSLMRFPQNVSSLQPRHLRLPLYHISFSRRSSKFHHRQVLLLTILLFRMVLQHFPTRFLILRLILLELFRNVASNLHVLLPDFLLLFAFLRRVPVPSCPVILYKPRQFRLSHLCFLLFLPPPRSWSTNCLPIVSGLVSGWSLLSSLVALRALLHQSVFPSMVWALLFYGSSIFYLLSPHVVGFCVVLRALSSMVLRLGAVSSLRFLLHSLSLFQQSVPMFVLRVVCPPVWIRIFPHIASGLRSLLALVLLVFRRWRCSDHCFNLVCPTISIFVIPGFQLGSGLCMPSTVSSFRMLVQVLLLLFAQLSLNPCWSPTSGRYHAMSLCAGCAMWLYFLCAERCRCAHVLLNTPTH